MKPKCGFPRVVIGGLRGGSGKTILSIGLIAAWRKKGLSIAPYKKGPDYIDAGWLSSAAGLPCYNLDPFLIGKDVILSSFKGHFGKADCAVIEGNRGLYDGMDSAGTFSTAELSKLLNSPVLLIVDCTKMTRTTAAIVLGAKKFDPKIRINGVVLNRIAGTRHEKVIIESVERYCGIPVVGSIPKLNGDFLSERHMGLTPFQEHPDIARAISSARDIAENFLDLDRIWEIANEAVDLDEGERKDQIRKNNCKGREIVNRGQERRETDALHSPAVTIGIIKDSAFQFYYPENFEELEKRGAKLLEISALREKRLPDIDALYIGGGFPETHAIALAKNSSFRNSLKSAVENGLPVYAECGGLMYLGRSLSLRSKTYSMSGIFPVTFTLEKKPQAHGYTIVKVDGKNPFYKKGTVIRGHEFHYSKPSVPTGTILSFAMKRGQGLIEKRDGLCYKNVLATYTHVHAYGSPEWADGVIGRARKYQKERASLAGKK